MEPCLMTVPDVVARLSVSRAKVYELMARGELRSVRVGGSRRIHSVDLDRFIAELDATWPSGAYARRPSTSRTARFTPKGRLSTASGRA